MNNGTPLSANDLLRFGSLVLDVVSRVIRDREALNYWLRHTGEFESLTREFALKPGCRVLEVDRTTHAAYSGCEISTQNSLSALITELDLSKVRYIPYAKFSAERHVHLDSFALATMLRRQDVLPAHLMRSPKRSYAVAFMGTEFKKPDDDYVRVSTWYADRSHDAGMSFVRKEGSEGCVLSIIDFVAVLLKD